MSILYLHLSSSFKWVLPREEEIRKTLLKHLLQLPPEDRYLRFFGPLGDAAIENYVKKINLFDGSIFLACEGLPDKIIGFLHLAGSSVKEAEIGVSVDNAFRNKGIGYELFKQACVHAVNKGCKKLYVNCLYQNVAMQKMVKKLGSQYGDVSMTSDGDTKTASINLPGIMNPYGMMIENTGLAVSFYDLAYRQHLQRFDRFMRARK